MILSLSTLYDNNIIFNIVQERYIGYGLLKDRHKTNKLQNCSETEVHMNSLNALSPV